MLGAISRIVWRISNVTNVGIDVRLNDCGGTKFQPDIVGYDNRDDSYKPVIIIDYESPNSSDARIPTKDWEQYANWPKPENKDIPYFVITTLPNKMSPAWELSWTGKNQCNAPFSGERNKIRLTPFAFWYDHYKKQSGKYNLNGIQMINIDSGSVKVEPLDR
jgi:hypothetical protein